RPGFEALPGTPFHPLNLFAHRGGFLPEELSMRDLLDPREAHDLVEVLMQHAAEPFRAGQVAVWNTGFWKVLIQPLGLKLLLAPDEPHRSREKRCVIGAGIAKDDVSDESGVDALEKLLEFFVPREPNAPASKQGYDRLVLQERSP